jgi:glucose-1-phosphate cytidylyltransferase
MSQLENIPVLILAGGLGTRLSEETGSRPKPMVDIGGIPILLHLMRWYYSFGFNDFVICAGYKGWEIKNYFLTYAQRFNHFEVDFREGLASSPSIYQHRGGQERWRVRVLDTGEETMTGGRVAKALDLLSQEQFEHFALTYGDGLSDIDLQTEFNFHLEHKKVGTVLGVHPLARFGELETDGKGIVTSFLEKPQGRQGQINGGFFFFRRQFREYVQPSDDCILEREPLVKLASDRQLALYPHNGFWQPMDTLRDKTYLETLWSEGKAPWSQLRRRGD